MPQLATTITFEAGSTTTLTDFSVTGVDSVNTVTLNSATPGTQFNLLKTTETVNASYLRIQDSNAFAAFFANTNSIDLGNNTGWNFTTSGVVQSNFSIFF
jgi:hypothetical protein